MSTDLLDSKATAQLLGVAARTLRRYVRQGAPVVKVAAQSFFERAAIVAWREAHQTPRSIGWQVRKAMTAAVPPSAVEGHLHDLDQWRATSDYVETMPKAWAAKFAGASAKQARKLLVELLAEAVYLFNRSDCVRGAQLHHQGMAYALGAAWEREYESEAVSPELVEIGDGLVPAARPNRRAGGESKKRVHPDEAGRVS